jgi:hypothetical protein
VPVWRLVIIIIIYNIIIWCFFKIKIIRCAFFYACTKNVSNFFLESPDICTKFSSPFPRTNLLKKYVDTSSVLTTEFFPYKICMSTQKISRQNTWSIWDRPACPESNAQTRRYTSCDIIGLALNIFHKNY